MDVEITIRYSEEHACTMTFGRPIAAVQSNTAALRNWTFRNGVVRVFDELLARKEPGLVS